MHDSITACNNGTSIIRTLIKRSDRLSERQLTGKFGNDLSREERLENKREEIERNWLQFLSVSFATRGRNYSAT